MSGITRIELPLSRWDTLLHDLRVRQLADKNIVATILSEIELADSSALHDIQHQVNTMFAGMIERREIIETISEGTSGIAELADIELPSSEDPDFLTTGEITSG